MINLQSYQSFSSNRSLNVAPPRCLIQLEARELINYVILNFYFNRNSNTLIFSII